MRLDIADYFGSINQHILINTLKGNGVDPTLCDRLELLLLSYTGQRSSKASSKASTRSDLFGAFYMHPIDRFFDDNEIAAARYVDDIYVFIESVDAADRAMRFLIPELDPTISG